MEETYTDNVSLSPAGSARTEWVTQVSPGVSVASNGARLKANLVYSAQLLYRVNSETHGTSHSLNANGKAELARQLLYVDAASTISQVNSSLFGPQTNSNVNTTGNRTSVTTFSVSPYLRYSFGVDAQGEARLTYSRASYASVNDGVNNAQTTAADGTTTQLQGIALRLVSGPAFKLYTWSLDYTKDRTERSYNPDVTMERFTAVGKRLITPFFALTSSAGYESIDYAVNTSASGLQTQGGHTFWNYGLDWNPSPRTHLAVTTGKRFYGSSHSLDFSYRTRVTIWSARYSESVTTTHSQSVNPANVSTVSFLDPLFASAYPDPVARAAAVQNYIAQNGLPATTVTTRSFLTDQVYLLKAFNASAGYVGARQSLIATVFKTKSQSNSVSAALNGVGAGDFAASSNVESTGASLAGNARITQLISANANVSYARSEFPGISSASKTSTKSFSIGVSEQFSQKLSGTLNYRKLKNDATQAGASYTENAVVAKLNYRY